eukprot:m.181354 g.181354  ORF g.181354 m.181354 type:complete len:315 (-) comp32059_c0_seq3:72-1016(-)
MGLYRIHGASLKRHHYAPLCSAATMFQIISIACTLVIPFYIAYNSAGMWIYERCYRLQPDVHFKHDAFLVGRSEPDFSLMVWSTSSNFNTLMQKRLRIPTLRSYEHDENLDGIYDWLDIEAEIPLEDDERLSGVSVLLTFDYQLKEMVNLRMESVAFFDYTGVGSGSELSVDGPLVLKQKDSLSWSGTRTVYNTPVINTSSTDAESFDFAKVLRDYANRNETTVYEPSFAVWKADRGAGQPFTLKMRVRYDSQRLCFRPQFLQELKFGWIQYLSILVPFIVWFDYVRWFVFSNNIVSSVTQLDARTTNILRKKQ